VVQLRHDAKETTWDEHGDVTVSTPEGVLLGTVPKAQHNSNYHARRSLLAALAKKVLASLEQEKTKKVKGNEDETEDEQPASSKAKEEPEPRTLIRSSSADASG
jgi:hypothetical protein